MSKKAREGSTALAFAETEIGVKLADSVGLAARANDECLDHDPTQYKLLFSLYDPDDGELADGDLESLWRTQAIDDVFKRHEPRPSRQA